MAHWVSKQTQTHRFVRDGIPASSSTCSRSASWPCRSPTTCTRVLSCWFAWFELMRFTTFALAPALALALAPLAAAAPPPPLVRLPLELEDAALAASSPPLALTVASSTRRVLRCGLRSWALPSRGRYV